MDLIDIKPKDFVDTYFNRIAKFREIDIPKLKGIAENIIKCSKKQLGPEHQNRELENQWYASLEKGEPDYTVYDSDLYFSDLWSCWALYSRNYLKEIRNPKSLIQYGGILNHLGKVKKVVDTGCGFGLTTIALTQMFPNAEVIGTNIPDTIQYQVAEDFGKEYGFRLVSSLEEVGTDVDLVFSSEYFEHFDKPLMHLAELLHVLNPKALIVANSFGTRSIGHFLVDGRKTSKAFNQFLLSKSYNKVKTKIWNNKPALWMK